MNRRPRTDDIRAAAQAAGRLTAQLVRERRGDRQAETACRSADPLRLRCPLCGSAFPQMLDLLGHPCPADTTEGTA